MAAALRGQGLEGGGGAIEVGEDGFQVGRGGCRPGGVVVSRAMRPAPRRRAQATSWAMT